MTSTLEAQFTKSRDTACAALEARSDELAAEEADIAESRVRFEAERLVDFYDELGDRQVGTTLHPLTKADAVHRKVAEDVATIIRRFKNFERTMGETTASALRLTSLPLDETTHVSQYNIILNHIGTFQTIQGQFFSLALMV